MISKIVIGMILAILVGSAGYWAWMEYAASAPTPAPVKNEPVTEEKSTYASSTMKFAIRYPKNFTLQDPYAYEAFGSEKLIHGVKFQIPLTTATGTNLSGDTGISVETLPRAKNCTGDIFLLADVKAQIRTVGSTTYSVATSSEGAAGNLYEESVFALASSSPCIAVRYFIHSTNIENYEPGSVRQFDRNVLIELFDEIRNTLMLQ